MAYREASDVTSSRMAAASCSDIAEPFNVVSNGRGRDASGSRDGDDEREVVMKSINRQYICRGLVCLAAASIIGGGAVILSFGIYASSMSAADWLPRLLGDQRSDAVSSGSLGIGIAMAVLGLVGCFGAFRRKKPCLWLFGLLVAVLLTIIAGSIAILFETRWALDQWSDASFRLYAGSPPVAANASNGGASGLPATTSAANLTDGATETLQALYGAVAALAIFCHPPAANVSRTLDALDSSRAPTDVRFSCTEASLDAFGDWCGSRALARAHAHVLPRRVLAHNCCHAGSVHARLPRRPPACPAATLLHTRSELGAGRVFTRAAGPSHHLAP